MRRAYVAASILAFLALAAPRADAGPIVLTPGDTTCTTNDNSNFNGAKVLAKVQACFGATSTSLSLYYKSNVGGGEEGTYATSYNTVFANSALDPMDATISYISGLAIVCPECYLVVKDGRQTPAQYFFDLGSWNGTDEIQLRGFWPANGAISNIAIWGHDIDLPDGPEPAMLLLFGTGAAGLVRRLRRRRSQ